MSLLPSATLSIDLPSVFSPPSPHCHLPYSSMNPTASSMHLSSTSTSSYTPATSLPQQFICTPGLLPRFNPNHKDLFWVFSLLFAVFILLLPLVLYSLSCHFCPQFQPPTCTQDTIIHIPLQQFTAPEPTSSLPSPLQPPLPAKNKDIYVYENTEGTTLYAVSDSYFSCILNSKFIFLMPRDTRTTKLGVLCFKNILRTYPTKHFYSFASS